MLLKASVEFLWWGLQSYFRVQPNNCVEVVLRCVVVGAGLGWAGVVITYNYPDNLRE